jgi:ribosomal protein S18 acetylase RimI-like enzyme
MKIEDFIGYKNILIADFAKDKELAEGMSKEDALKVSMESTERLLPKGLDTENNFIFTIFLNIVKPIGYIWFAKNKNEVFIYDFIINEKFRGNGYSKLAMTELEKEVKKHEISVLKLHVFGNNKIARNLYKNQGFIETNVQMKKELS